MFLFLQEKNKKDGKTDTDVESDKDQNIGPWKCAHRN